MEKIETGVDKLMELINKEKEISVEDAAKKLGISKIVIQEWSDFLDEEKLITIEYKFSKTILKERKLSEKEVKDKKKEYSTEKDAFVRKVENSLKNLESDSLGLERIKKEFAIIKKDIGSEIDKVEGKVKDLEKYEYLKKNLDKEIEKQVAEFKLIIDNAHKDLDIEQKKHQSILEDLEIEKREFQVKEKRVRTLEETETDLMKRIQEIISVSKEVGKKVDTEKIELSSSEKKIMDMEKLANDIENNIKKRKMQIEPLLQQSKKHEEKIILLQEDILKKAKEKTRQISDEVNVSTKATSRFKEFFNKKSEISNLITQIDKEKTELEQSFKNLEKKALVFDLTTKNNVVSTHIKELEKESNALSKKRSSLKVDLEKLIKLVKG
ncbi:MAG: hypothetical protein ABIJ34_00395 [archaeon]